MIRQLLRTERSLFSTAFTLFDHWLLLIWHCPLSSNDFPLIDPTSHLSQRIKGVKLRPDSAYGPCDVLPTECALAPTISNSVSFVLIGTGLGCQWEQKGLCNYCEPKPSWMRTFHLRFFTFLTAANFMVVTMKYIFNKYKRSLFKPLSVTKQRIQCVVFQL